MASDEEFSGLRPPSDSAPSHVDDSPSQIRQCRNCPTRLSIVTYDGHTICHKCRAKYCSMNDRCDECCEWSDAKFRNFSRHRDRLESKRKSKALRRKADKSKTQSKGNYDNSSLLNSPNANSLNISVPGVVPLTSGASSSRVSGVEGQGPPDWFLQSMSLFMERQDNKMKDFVSNAIDSAMSNLSLPAPSSSSASGVATASSLDPVRKIIARVPSLESGGEEE